MEGVCGGAAVCEIEAPDVSQELSAGMGRNGKNNQEAWQEGAWQGARDFTRSRRGNIFPRA